MNLTGKLKEQVEQADTNEEAKKIIILNQQQTRYQLSTGSGFVA